MRFTFPSGLRARLVILVLVAIVPALVLLQFFVAQERQAARAEAGENALRVARLASSNNVALVEGTRQLFVALARLPEVRGGDSDACNKLMADLLQRIPRYRNLGATDPSGEIFCFGDEPGRTHRADDLWFQRAVETKDFAIGEYMIGVQGRTVVAFGFPVLDSDGQVQAVLWAPLLLGWLADLAAETHLPEGSTLMLLDGKGNTLVRYPEPVKWQGKPVPDSLLAEVRASPEGEGTVEVADLDDVTRLYAFIPLKGTYQVGDAYVGVGIPLTVAFAEADRSFRRNLSLLGLVAVLGLAAAWIGGDLFILRRVKSLVGAARRLQAGDLTARTHASSGGGELGQLARAFDEMSAALQQREVQLKQAEEEARRAQQTADQANQAKSEFLSRMSHELRTPLNAVLGFGQLLEMDNLAPAQRESVEYILRAGRHLLDLINEVLDISRIEAGHLGLSPEPVPIAEVAKEAIDLIQPLAMQRKVQLVSGAVPGKDLHVLADRQRLKQVLLNLLSNAVKYNREGGTVALSCDPVGHGQQRISVVDTGPGIPPERLGRLFTPFERLGAEQTGVEGTGLGLALSKRLVEAMKGTIGVESTVGQGSTFWLELPVAEGPLERLQRTGEGIQAPTAAGALEEGQNLLYIEDNLSNLQLIRRVLAQRPQVKLISAMQGQMGLDLAREHRPSLILLDLHLPDIPGEEVLRRLQGDAETKEIPVVVISADATQGQIKRLAAAGARAYLTKPLDIPQFLKVVSQILEEEREARP